METSHDGDDRSDPNVYQNAPVNPRFKTVSVFYNGGNKHKSGDEALARVYGELLALFFFEKSVKTKISAFAAILRCFLRRKIARIRKDSLFDYHPPFCFRTPSKIIIVVSLGLKRAVSLFDIIEAIIWKPNIASIVPIGRIASIYFETMGAIGTIRTIIWKPGLNQRKFLAKNSVKTYSVCDVFRHGSKTCNKMRWPLI